MILSLSFLVFRHWLHIPRFLVRCCFFVVDRKSDRKSRAVRRLRLEFVDGWPVTFEETCPRYYWAVVFSIIVIWKLRAFFLSPNWNAFQRGKRVSCRFLSSFLCQIHVMLVFPYNCWNFAPLKCNIFKNPFLLKCSKKKKINFKLNESNHFITLHNLYRVNLKTYNGHIWTTK